MEDILVGMGFDPEIVKQCLAERPSATIEAQIEHILAAGVKSEPAVTSPEAAPGKPPSLPWREIPELDQIYSLCKQNKLCFLNSQLKEQSHIDVCNALLEQRARCTAVLQLFEDMSKTFSEYFLQDLAEAVTSGKAASDIVFTVDAILENYQRSIAWSVGSVCVAVEMIDPGWVAQKIRTSKKEPSEDAISPALVGSFASEWEQYVAGIAARLDDSNFLISGDPDLVAKLGKPESSHIPSEVLCRIVPLRTAYHKKSGGPNKAKLIFVEEKDFKKQSGLAESFHNVSGVKPDTPFAVPLVCLMSKERQSRFYSTDPAEIKSREESKSWKNLGTVCWVYPSATPFTVPLFASKEPVVFKKGKKKDSDVEVFEYVFSFREPLDTSAEIIGHVVPSPKAEDFVSLMRPLWNRVAHAVAGVVTSVDLGASEVDPELISKCSRCVKAICVFGAIDSSIAENLGVADAAIAVNPCSHCKKELGPIVRHCLSGCNITDAEVQLWKCSVCDSTQCCTGLYSCCRCCTTCQTNKSPASIPVKSSGQGLIAHAMGKKSSSLLDNLEVSAKQWRSLPLAAMIERAANALRVCTLASECLGPVSKNLVVAFETSIRALFVADMFQPLFELFFPPEECPAASEEVRAAALDVLVRSGNLFGQAGDKKAAPLIEAYSKSLQAWATRSVVPLAANPDGGSLVAIQALANCITTAVSVAESMTQRENGEPGLTPYLWTGLHSAFERVITSLGGRVEEWANVTINVLLDSADDSHSPGDISLEALTTVVSMLQNKGGFLEGFRRRLIQRVGRLRSKSLDDELRVLRLLRDRTGLSFPTETAFVNSFKTSQALTQSAIDQGALTPAMSVAVISESLELSRSMLSPGLSTASLLQGCIHPHLATQADNFAAFFLIKFESDFKKKDHRPPPLNLKWQFGLGNAEVVVGDGPITAIVPSAALPVLYQLDLADGATSYENLRQKCGISEPLLQGVLLSLTAPRHPMLRISSERQDVVFTPDTIFELNATGFAGAVGPADRVLIRSVQVSVSADTVAKLPPGYAAASIIRILRHRKGGMTQQNLLECVCDFVRHRAVVKLQDLLPDLEQVIEQGFAVRGRDALISFRPSSEGGDDADESDIDLRTNDCRVVPLAAQHISVQPIPGITRSYSHTALAENGEVILIPSGISRVESGITEAFSISDSTSAVESALSLLSQVGPDFGRDLSVVHAASIMSSFSWDPVAIHRAIAASSLENVFTANGIVAKSKSSTGADGSICGTCLCEVEPGEPMLTLECGHSGHVDCFSGYLKSKLNPSVADGEGPFLPLSLRCPFVSDCKNLVSESAVETSSPDNFSQYMTALHSQIISSFMRSTQAVVECKCGRVLRCRSTAVVVSCPCGQVFCVGCKRLDLPNSAESHAPASCLSLQRYHLLANPSMDRFNLLRMKNCPSCQHPVNKCGCKDAIVCDGLDVCPNAACDHITCTQCSHQWCWICRGAWKGHDGSLHSTPVDEKEIFQKAQTQFVQHTTRQKEIVTMIETVLTVNEHPCRTPILALLHALRRSHRTIKYAYIAAMGERLEKLLVLLHSSFGDVENLIAEGTARATEGLKAITDGGDGAGLTPASFMDKASALEMATKGMQTSWFCDWFIRAESKEAELTKAAAMEEARLKREARIAQFKDKIIKSGSIVRRGMDWQWNTQDHHEGAPSEGKVTNVPTPGHGVWVNVTWASGNSNTYRWGEEGAYDLEIITEPDDAESE